MKKMYTLISTFLTLGIAHAQWTDVSTPGLEYGDAMTELNGSLYMATAKGVFATADGGLDWDTLVSGLPVVAGYTFTRTLKNYGGVLYTGTNSSNLWNSTDGGQNWNNTHANLFVGGAPEVNYFYKNNDVMLSAFGSSAGFKYSFDGGANWSSASFPAGVNKTVGRSVVAIGSELFAVCLGGVIHSTDNGASWNLVGGSGLPVFGGLSGTLFESNDKLIMCLYLSGTYISSDSGATWTAVTGPAGESLSSITCIEGNDDVVFAAGPVGYFQSNDNGATWISIKDNLLSTQVCYSMTLVGDVLYLYDGLGLHKRTVSSGSAGLDKQAKMELKLYPNPVSGEKVQLEVPAAGQVEIYTTQGQVLKKQKLEAGKNQLDLTGLQAGTYFVRFQNERISKQRTIQKM